MKSEMEERKAVQEAKNWKDKEAKDWEIKTPQYHCYCSSTQCNEAPDAAADTSTATTGRAVLTLVVISIILCITVT